MNCEEDIYHAKDLVAQGNADAYQDARLQQRYKRLSAIGLAPPPVPLDVDAQAVDAIVVYANAKCHAFTGMGRFKCTWPTANYVRVISILAARNIPNWWVMGSDTAPSHCSLHRGGVDNREDFIYHL